MSHLNNIKQMQKEIEDLGEYPNPEICGEIEGQIKGYILSMNEELGFLKVLRTYHKDMEYYKIDTFLFDHIGGEIKEIEQAIKLVEDKK